MPSGEIMKLYREGRLHSGPNAIVVTKESQAKAILMAYLKKEGKTK